MATNLRAISYVIYALVIVYIIRVFLNFLQARKNRNLLNEGKYEEAIQIYEKLHKKHLKYKNYNGFYLFNVAKCYYRMGKFKNSNHTLDSFNVKDLPDNYKVIYYGMYAANLVLMGKDLEKAYKYILEARKIYDMPDLILNQALIEKLQDKPNAEETFVLYKEKSDSSPKQSKGDTFGKDIVENYLLGLYYQKSKEKNLSKEYFEKAAKNEYDNYFSNQAKEFIK